MNDYGLSYVPPNYENHIFFGFNGDCFRVQIELSNSFLNAERKRLEDIKAKLTSQFEDIIVNDHQRENNGNSSSSCLLMPSRGGMPTTPSFFPAKLSQSSSLIHQRYFRHLHHSKRSLCTTSYSRPVAPSDEDHFVFERPSKLSMTSLSPKLVAAQNGSISPSLRSDAHQKTASSSVSVRQPLPASPSHSQASTDSCSVSSYCAGSSVGRKTGDTTLPSRFTKGAILNSQSSRNPSPAFSLSPVKRQLDAVAASTSNNDATDTVDDASGALISGSLTALIRKLIPRKDYFPDKSFIFTFLLNVRTSISPADLLHEIMQFCIFEQDMATERFKKESVTRFFLNIVKLLKEWTENFSYDFRDATMVEKVNELLDLCSSADGALKQHCMLLLQNLYAKMSKLDRYEAALQNITNDATVELLPSENSERLSMIGPDEFVYYFARGFIKGEPPASKISNRTENIQFYADWFNRLTQLVASEVCKLQQLGNGMGMGEAFEAGCMAVPTPIKLSNTNEDFPYVILADEAFPLKSYILRPFPGRDLTEEKAIFNYRLSRARRCIENAFGILSTRFRIFRRAIIAEPCVVDNIVKGYADADNNGELVEGLWRNEPQPEGLVNGRVFAGNRAANDAINTRTKFMNYFNSQQGQVPWQYEYVRRGSKPQRL